VVEPINLNRARKAKAGAEKKAQAAANRVRYGQAKGAKLASKLEAERSRRDLDGKKRD